MKRKKLVNAGSVSHITHSISKAERKSQPAHALWRDKKHEFFPKKVEYFAKKNLQIKKIVAGMYHTCALTTDDDLYTWGRGLYGVLGNGSN